MLDQFNRYLSRGYSINEAVIQAGKSRFRAIILTTITTVAGLYPLILEKSFQAQFLIPMAISVAFGVLLDSYGVLGCDKFSYGLFCVWGAYGVIWSYMES